METSFPQFQQSSKLGKLEIAPEVIESITALAANEIDGVAQLNNTFVGGIAEKLGRKKKLNKGVKVELGEHHTVVDAHIIVDYGVKIPDVASAVQDHVKSTIQDLTGLDVLEVNIHVVGVYVRSDNEDD